MSEFDYKQRVVEDKERFDENYDRVFGLHNCKDQAEADLLNHIYECEKAKLNEEKRPLVKD